MKIAITGSGYVGLVSGAGLAEVGHHVLCMDINQQRIDGLLQGSVPIFEPGLDMLVQQNMQQGRLDFTASLRDAVCHAEVLFIAVGTPPGEDGAADLSHVLAVAKGIGQFMQKPLLVVTKSAVPVGTSEQVKRAIAAELEARGADIAFWVASNPEFLKEGAAIADFMKPDRIVVGTEDPHAEQLLRELYAPFNRNHERLLCMDVRSAELTKYAANVMLATKISLMNELANIAERVGADIEHIRIGIGSDPRIGYAFIYPGVGYGGSCFPKDVRALERTARQHGYDAALIRSVEEVNKRQKNKPLEKLQAHFGATLADRRIALWGLSFKPDTDDIRDAPSLDLIRSLLDLGCQVVAHDPQAGAAATACFSGYDGFAVVPDPYAAASGADALVLMTEWRLYRAPDFARLHQLMNQAVIVDGRNIWSPEVVRRRGFSYYAIGRP